MKATTRATSFGIVAVFVAAVWTVATANSAEVSPKNLVINGDFQQGAEGWGEGQLKRKGVALRSEAGNTWLSIDGYSSVNQTLSLDPEWAYLRVRMRMRVTDVVMGPEGWHDARLAMNFVDQSGKHLDPWPNVFHAAGTSQWTDYERVFKIPARAARLELSPSMFGASGRAEFDDIVVTVAGTRSGLLQDVPLPAGADDLADLSKAWRKSSPTRETICLNGLWRFVPASEPAAQTPPGPDRGWGWFKVPGIWPSSAEDTQQILLPMPPDDAELRNLDQAWYQRPLNIPAQWSGRRILLDFTMLQTHARVLLDGQAAGELFFPGGLLDVTSLAKPGTRQVLSVLVTARPLEKESNVFMAPVRIISSKAVLRCKGLTGDVFLVSRPAGEALGDVRVVTSTRQGTITFDTALQNVDSGQYSLEARVYEDNQLVKTFTGESFGAAALKNGRITLSDSWTDAKRWDLNAPENLYTAVVTLRDQRGAVLDESLPIRFGFREFWIDGRDFYLNGSRIHLRFIHTTNIAGGADQSSLEGGRNTCRRMQEYGFNAFITSNYSFGPGEVGYLDGLFNAADEEGVLASFTLPHAKDFSWKLNTPAQAQRYRALCEWLVRRAQNHPSVVLYAMNHNATGYKGDQNPLWMDGVYRPDEEWTKTNPAKLHNRREAMIAEQIAKQLDPSRPVYHHQSGNLGDLYTVNIYLNWAPRQERSDWLEHWAKHGVKPMFFVEWGLPHVSSWSSYRGPQFIWRYPAMQQIWDSEYAAAYVGQQAYRMTPTKVKSMEWEEELWAKGEPFYWSNLIRYFRSQDENYTQVQALFAADNWRSHRTWGISAMLPWDQENLWRAPEEAGRRIAAERPYQDLEQPGISPDRVAPVERQWIYSRDVSNIRPSVLGEAFLRWNMPLCGYIAGGGSDFTEKGHNFMPGETVQKNIALLNDTREAVTCRYRWSLAGIAAQGSGAVPIEPGGKVLQPITIALPKALAPGRYVLSATFDFEPGGRQADSQEIDVLPPRTVETPNSSRIAVYDPQGDTAQLLKKLGVEFRNTTPDQAADCDLLVIGRRALRSDGPLPGFDQVARGLKILVFEQDAETLTGRFGFRINVHGLRQVFARVPSHPALAGLTERHLCDWRGSATNVPPYFDLKSVDENDPTWKWCGFENTRVWRCGNRGSVATVLIEKPERGDFLPIVDGGFDLQYAPLLEYTEGKGRVVFCQLDVTGRTEDDPAAQRLCVNLVRHLQNVQPKQPRSTHVMDDGRTKELLRQLGVVAEAGDAPPGKTGLLVLGSGAAAPPDLRKRVEAGLNLLCLGLGPEEIQRALPGLVRYQSGPTLPARIERFDHPVLAGLSNAELHWRTRATIATLQETSEQSNEALCVVPLGQGQVVFCQAAPWMFDYAKRPYLRTTYRRNVLLVSRLLYNLGAVCRGPTIAAPAERYLQSPVADDDPYRYYRW